MFLKRKSVKAQDPEKREKGEAMEKKTPKGQWMDTKKLTTLSITVTIAMALSFLETHNFIFDTWTIARPYATDFPRI